MLRYSIGQKSKPQSDASEIPEGRRCQSRPAGHVGIIKPRNSLVRKGLTIDGGMIVLWNRHWWMALHITAGKSSTPGARLTALRYELRSSENCQILRDELKVWIDQHDDASDRDGSEESCRIISTR